MKRKTGFLYITAVIILGTPRSNAQEDSTGSRPEFSLGLYHITNLNYYGRVDSLRSNGLFPLAQLSIKGFYVNAAPVFTYNHVSSLNYAGTVMTIGYRFKVHETLGAHLFAVKPFYKTNTDLVQSALKAQFVSNFSWTNKIVNLNAGADLKLSDQTDYGLSVGMDHAFRFKKNKALWVVNPVVSIHAGTQRFTNTYYQKKSFLIFPATQQEITEQTTQFSILSYEMSMPIVLAIGKIQIMASPGYVIPKNVIQMERAKEMFYLIAGCKLVL